jgi:hypothetical protein
MAIASFAGRISGLTPRRREKLLPTFGDSEAMKDHLKRFADLAMNGGNRPYLEIELSVEWAHYNHAMFDVMYYRIQLDYFAAKYNLYNCWNTESGFWSPSSGGDTMPGPSLGGSTTQYGWVCSTRLQNDENGNLIPVESCEYIFAA